MLGMAEQRGQRNKVPVGIMDLPTRKAYLQTSVFFKTRLFGLSIVSNGLNST